MQGTFGYVFRGEKADIDKILDYDKSHENMFEAPHPKLKITPDNTLWVWQVDGSCYCGGAQDYLIDIAKAIPALEGASWLKYVDSNRGYYGYYSEADSMEAVDIDTFAKTYYVNELDNADEIEELIVNLEEEGDYDTTFMINGIEFTLCDVYSDCDGYYCDYGEKSVAGTIDHEPARKLIEEANFWF